MSPTPISLALLLVIYGSCGATAQEPGGGGAGETETVEEEAAENPPPVTLTPYAKLVLNFYFNTDDLAFADIPFVASGGDDTALGATVRQSRVGLRGSAPAAAEAMSIDALDAVVEIDFIGGSYPEANNTYFMAHPRLRLLAAELATGIFRIRVGQDWIPLSPLNPFSLVHVAVAGFQGAGNLWARLPQVSAGIDTDRFDARIAVLAPNGGGDAQAAPVTPMNPGEPGLSVGRSPSASDRSNMPSLQARAAYAIPIEERALELGLSGHFGLEENALADATVPSWAVVLDVDLPILEFLTLEGEVFAGANLDGFFSNADLVGSDAVRAFGGWGQVSARFVGIGLHVGGGVEDVVAPGGAVLADGRVDLNGAFYGAVTYRTGPFETGLELTYLHTERVNAPTANGAQIGLAATLDI